MRSEIRIGKRTIGDGHPLFITAECGVTCNYDMDITKKLVDTVAEAGGDAIKLIFWFPEEFMSDHAVSYEYETVNGKTSENMFEMLDKLRFSLDEWKDLKKYADSRGVILFSTVNCPSGIVWAEAIGLEAYKLSSWDFNHLPLWRKIAKIGKPMIIDTGPVGVLDVSKVLTVMQEEGNDQAILVHCYHTDLPEEKNMRAIPYMKKAFGTVVGFSAKNYRDEMDIAAIPLGATFLEKRLTLKRDLPGHHHAISKEPEEFKAYVEMVRRVHASLGVEALIPSRADLAERKEMFRHLCANRDLKKGTILKEADLEGKRPETSGISPEHEPWFIGRELKRDLKENEAIAWKDV